MGKWNRFREARAKVVDTYIEAKRTQLLNKLVITHVIALVVVKKLDASCRERLARHQRENRRVWMALVVAKHWRRKLSRFGGLENIFRQQVRHSFYLSGIHAQHGVERRAKHIVFQFWVYQYGLNMFVKKLKLWMGRIGFIQRQHRLRQQLLDARLEVLENQWNKIINYLAQKAHLLNDSPTKELLDGIVRVPKRTRQLVLRLYLQKCQELHSVAFLQWRKTSSKNPNFDVAA
jgi:hypothetical protein